MRLSNVLSLSVGAFVVAGTTGIAYSSDTPQAVPRTQPVSCEEAVVNPISGHAECVRPRGAPVAPPPPRPSVIKLAVFDFELDDVSPAASLLNQSGNSETLMKNVSSEARRTLAQSGRYFLVDTSPADTEPLRTKSLRDCGGCEAGLAAQLGAEQALVGIVRRITQTDYYVVVQISDAQTGKLVDQEAANFAGGPDGWASGVRMLIEHQVLAPADQL